MRRYAYMALLAAAAMLAAACHSSRPSAGASSGDTAPRACTEYLIMNIGAEAGGMHATGQVRVATDSVIWVAVYKIVELGRAKATRDSVWVNVPLAGHRFAGTYADLEQLTGRPLSFADLQEAVLGADASERLTRLAATMGVEATVNAGEPRRVARTDFPFASQ